MDRRHQGDRGWPEGKTGRAWGFWLGCLVLAGGWLPAHAATLTARLDRDTTTAGEPVTLSLVFEGGEPQAAVAIPAVPNLSVVFQGRSQQISVINGQYSASFTHNYMVTPLQAGDFTLPAVTAVVGGSTLRSQPVQLRVLKGEVGDGSAGAQPRAAFLRLLVPKTQVYLGEAIPLEIRLYYQNARNVQMPQLKAEGFTLGKMAEPVQSSTVLGNARYNVVVFRLTATPVKTGDLALGPAECPLEVILPRTNRRSRSPFDSLFDDPFDILPLGGQVRPARLLSEPQTLRVQPLPRENVPPDFQGAVGSYALRATLSTNVVTAGDPLTLTVRIEGRGPIDALPLNLTNLAPQFKTYPPVTRVETTDDLGLSGAKVFEQVIVPENAEVKEIPPLAFSFFDPDKRAYRTVSQPPIPLTVRPSGVGAAQPVVLATRGPEARDARAATDIVHIKSRPGLLALAQPPWLRQPWFLVCQTLPLVVWLGSWLWRRRRDRLAANPRLRRQQQVARSVRHGLTQLRQQAAAHQPTDFFTTVFRLLQEQLGERLDLPASAITEAVVDDRLAPRGVPEETRALVQELFQTCNLARYAPGHAAQDLTEVVPKVEAALRAIQRIPSHG